MAGGKGPLIPSGSRTPGQTEASSHQQPRPHRQSRKSKGNSFIFSEQRPEPGNRRSALPRPREDTKPGEKRTAQMAPVEEPHRALYGIRNKPERAERNPQSRIGAAPEHPFFRLRQDHLECELVTNGPFAVSNLPAANHGR